jgi:hypothetical protein
MRRSAILAAVAVSLAMGAPAAAAPPTQERIAVDDAFTFPSGELCASRSTSMRPAGSS